MGVKRLLRYAKDCGLYEKVDLEEVANDFKTRSGCNPVIVVDGSHCVSYLHWPSDSIRGGQYKEFRVKCKEFVRRFRAVGIRLYFFFEGVPEKAQIPFWRKKRERKVSKISNLFARLREVQPNGDGRIKCKVQPAAVIPCAEATFKQTRCEVRLSVADLHTEMAKFAATNECCIGILSDNAEFLIYDRVPSLFAFSTLQVRGKLKVWRFQSTKIVSHLGIQMCDLPTFASLVGNNILSYKDLSLPHKTLSRMYGSNKVIDLVAEFLKTPPRGDLRGMCEVLFGANCEESLKLLETSVLRYRYEVEESEAGPSFPGWDKVLRHVEAKHVCHEIPEIVYTVMKYRLWSSSAVLEDLSVSRPNFPQIGLKLRDMRERMYRVLLWESDTGPFQVTEYISIGLGEVPEEIVVVHKSLPEGIHHPGLLELWSGPADRRWRTFAWMISPARDLWSALKALFPLPFVVPIAALFYLHHEAKVIDMPELRTFMIVAVAMKRHSARKLSRCPVEIPTERAIYLATLFVCTFLHVLDVAGACGLSANFQLERYFDGKLFHYVYSKSQQTFSSSDLPHWDKSCQATYSRLMKVIE